LIFKTYNVRHYKVGEIIELTSDMWERINDRGCDRRHELTDYINQEFMIRRIFNDARDDNHYIGEFVKFSFIDDFE